MFVTIVDNPFHKNILGYIVKHTHTTSEWFHLVTQV